MPKIREYKGLNYKYSDIGVPESELLSEDYIQHIITTDMTSLVGGIEGKGKIPMADSEGKISPSWLYDDVVATTLPKADEETAVQIYNDDVAMTPRATYLMINSLIHDASLTEKGIVKLTDNITPDDDRINIAVTPKALKNALANNFVSATYTSYGLTKYADVNIMKTLQTNVDDKPTTTVESEDNSINSTSVTPNRMYDFISNNVLNLNTKNRRGTNTKGYTALNFRTFNSSSDKYELRGRLGATDAGEVRLKSYTGQRIVVGQSESISGDYNTGRSLVLMDADGNTKISNILYGSLSNTVHLPPKLGDKSYGSSSKPIYIDKGVITECNSIDNVPSANTANVANKLGESSVGENKRPIYLNNGVPTQISYTIEKSVPSTAVFTDTNTKVNVTLGTTTKAFLLGTTTTPTSTATGVTAIADTGVYLDTTAGMITATSFKGDLKGNADTATKLSSTSTKTGDTNTPIYLNNGVPTAINYTIDKSVPSDAVFTDTVTTVNSTVSGSGNAVTSITASNGKLTLVKGSNFSLTSHNHDDIYALSGHNHDSSYAAKSHNHDSSYAAKNHTHSNYLTTSSTITATSATKLASAQKITIRNWSASWVIPAGTYHSYYHQVGSRSNTYVDHDSNDFDGSQQAIIELGCKSNCSGSCISYCSANCGDACTDSCTSCTGSSDER